jgi:drug/metabolite transporter (DMT)-like permease
MIYLLFSILCSTLILILFKLFQRFGVTNLYAIIANYLIAGALGYIFTAEPEALPLILEKHWLLPACGIGFLFITLFQIMAFTAQKLGVSRVSIAVKMSVALPVIAGIVLYAEAVSVYGWLGISLALLAVFLGTHKKGEGMKQDITGWLLLMPIVLFIGNGSIDVILKYAQHHWLQPTEMATFSGVLFGFAFLWGLLFGGYAVIVKKQYPTFKDLGWGLLLGIPNFGSIYFLLEALDKANMTSAAIYPINNVAIVGLSALSGVFFFKEKLSRINLVGLFAAFLAIVLLAYG